MENNIPTNHGMMGVQSIFDHLEYVSYRTQREAGVSIKTLKEWYPKFETLEQQYIKANLSKYNYHVE